MTFDEWYQANRDKVYGNLPIIDGDYELMERAFAAGRDAGVRSMLDGMEKVIESIKERRNV